MNGCSKVAIRQKWGSGENRWEYNRLSLQNRCSCKNQPLFQWLRASSMIGVTTQAPGPKPWEHLLPSTEVQRAAADRSRHPQIYCAHFVINMKTEIWRGNVQPNNLPFKAPSIIIDSAVYFWKDIKAKIWICKSIKRKFTFNLLWNFLSRVHVTCVFISKLYTCVVDPDIKWYEYGGNRGCFFPDVLGFLLLW